MPQQSVQPVELIGSQAPPSREVPLQGTANRRIKLRRGAPRTSSAEVFTSVEETKLQSSEESPKCVHSLFLVRMGKRQLMSVVCIILTFLVLLLTLLGGSQHVKRITRATVYKA